MVDGRDASAKPLLSVVIPTLNRNQPLCTAIDYFLTRETYRPFELIVVDQSDRHDRPTEEYLNRVASRIRLERVPFKSLPRARNYGVALARSEIIVFVDDDVEPWNGFLDAHLSPYTDPKVWMVTGPHPHPGQKVVGRSELSTRQLKDIMDGHFTGLHVDFDYSPCSWGGGCNISVRKSAAALVGGFDEKFLGNAVGEDAEFCNRIRQHGGIIYYAAAAGLVHVQTGEGGCRSVVGAENVKMFAYNQNYFFRAIGTRLVDRLQANWQSFRGMVFNRDNFDRRLPNLLWAFLVGVVRGLRQPLSQFPSPTSRP